jgi:hypothetical protein
MLPILTQGFLLYAVPVVPVQDPPVESAVNADPGSHLDQDLFLSYLSKTLLLSVLSILTQGLILTSNSSSPTCLRPF